MDRAWWSLLFVAACGFEPSPAFDFGLPARVRFVVEADGVAEGEIEVSRLIPADSGAEPFHLGPLTPGVPREAKLAGGHHRLVAMGDLQPHPGCEDTGAWARWEGEIQVLVSRNPPPPVDGVVHAIPGGEVEEVRIQLEPRCD